MTLDNISYILFIPRTMERWYYTLDEGKKHPIKHNDIIKFCDNYINYKYINTLIDILSRHQPFLIKLSDKSVHEMIKQDSNNDEERKQIIDSQPITKDMSQKELPMRSYFNKVDKFFKKPLSDKIK